MVYPAAKSIDPTHGIIGCSAWTARIRREIDRAAEFASNVLIQGPSGTGKELIARALHMASQRANEPFVPVDCTSMTGELLASHLFGHEKGAFTGADHATLGCFRTADHGTIFLDEIGEIELGQQAKLLRVLQQRCVIPVGGVEPVAVDVRVVAATNRDLRTEVAAGRFREDLFYRLNVVLLETEPLAKRSEDVLPLIRNFLAKMEVRHGIEAPAVSNESLALLTNYQWPGNVRQLENALERAVMYAEHSVIEPKCLPTEIVQSCADTPMPLEPEVAEADSSWPTLEQVECEHIRCTLESTSGNLTQAARLLAIDRNRLRRKLYKYGLASPTSAAKHRGSN